MNVLLPDPTSSILNLQTTHVHPVTVPALRALDRMLISALREQTLMLGTR